MSSPYDNSTNITFSSVRENANTINTCKNQMDSLFNEFGNTIRDLIAKEAFVGSAADAFEDKFNTLKGKFDSYVNTVNEFYNMISGAATSTEQTQKRLEDAANELSS